MIDKAGFRSAVVDELVAERLNRAGLADLDITKEVWVKQPGRRCEY